ncbi:MAG TPA: Rha family transcriptional regulator [Candidatus Omnitrophota bacterium]|nr:Rha family transcriptional regulator [Candidatus Omnitrophota bacterium]
MNYDVSIKQGISELGIFEKNSDAWVSSRDVARLFEKEHKHIMEAIREKIIPDASIEFSRSNFRPSKFKDPRGKTQPEYLLNRKSFSMVVMGFTGKRAMKFKEAYIEAFEQMATVIDTRKLSKAGYREMTSAVSQYIGKDPRMFAKEADMINQIVLGMKAADFRAVHNIDDSGFTRDSVVQSKLNALDRAQRLNAQLITAKVTECVRESIIRTNFSGKAIA